MDELVRQATNLIHPSNSKILEVLSFRPNYLSYPAKVTIETSTGIISQFVIKTAPKWDDITHEARILHALKEFGVPVPVVLAVSSPLEHNKPFFLLSILPGKPLPWLGDLTLQEADFAYQLFQHGVQTLHDLTSSISSHPIEKHLPRRTLLDDLDLLLEKEGPWFFQPLFREGLTLLQHKIPEVTTPLVFSNGDYNPLNFLYDGRHLTGFLDFTLGCFEDPFIGLAKFKLWGFDDFGWGTGNKAGFVERFLFSQNISPVQFAPRLVLRGLHHLQDAIGVNTKNDAVPREYILNILSQAIDILK